MENPFSISLIWTENGRFERPMSLNDIDEAIFFRYKRNAIKSMLNARSPVFMFNNLIIIGRFGFDWQRIQMKRNRSPIANIDSCDWEDWWWTIEFLFYIGLSQKLVFQSHGKPAKKTLVSFKTKRTERLSITVTTFLLNRSFILLPTCQENRSCSKFLYVAKSTDQTLKRKNYFQRCIMLHASKIHKSTSVYALRAHFHKCPSDEPWTRYTMERGKEKMKKKNGENATKLTENHISSDKLYQTKCLLGTSESQTNHLVNVMENNEIKIKIKRRDKWNKNEIKCHSIMFYENVSMNLIY